MILPIYLAWYIIQRTVCKPDAQVRCEKPNSQPVDLFSAKGVERRVFSNVVMSKYGNSLYDWNSPVLSADAIIALCCGDAMQFLRSAMHKEAISHWRSVGRDS